MKCRVDDIKRTNSYSVFDWNSFHNSACSTERCKGSYICGVFSFDLFKAEPQSYLHIVLVLLFVWKSEVLFPIKKNNKQKQEGTSHIFTVWCRGSLTIVLKMSRISILHNVLNIYIAKYSQCLRKMSQSLWYLIYVRKE